MPAAPATTHTDADHYITRTVKSKRIIHKVRTIMVSPQRYMDAVNNLPAQTAVWFILGVRERKIDVVASRIHPKYTIISELREDVMCMDKKTREYVRARVRDLHLGQAGEDKDGFYTGISLLRLGLLDLVNEQNDAQQCAIRDLAIPYIRYTIPNDVIETCIGNLPVVEDMQVGPLNVQKHGADPGHIAVSLNTQLSNYIICKIDQCSYLKEVELDEGFVATQVMFGSHWNSADLCRVRDNASRLISCLVDNVQCGGEWGYDKINPRVRELIKRGLNDKWEIMVHDDITIP